MRLLANGGSGFRLGRQMRRNGISTPLFLMTNSILSSMEEVAAASGANVVHQPHRRRHPGRPEVGRLGVSAAEPVARIDQLPCEIVVIESAPASCSRNTPARWPA